jgi:class 3 adenylate cyclase/putative methionine-R-sulfoxide reductase with GAF domain
VPSLAPGQAVRHRDKAGKARRHKALTRNTRKAASRNQVARSKRTNVARLARERDELLRQQTAMSEILGVISDSPTELAQVFNAILANATRLSKGNLAGLWLYDGEFLVGKAQYNASTAFVDKYMGIKIELSRAGPCRLAGLERRTVHVADITVEPGFSPKVLQYERARTVLAVPLLRDKELVGVIGIWRREVRPFTEQQIALVKTFANQAVIAIENARLLNELNKLNQQLEHRVADQVSEIERMGKLRRFLPPQVADLIVASGAEKQLESHRREITSLFCDLRGFTGFSESSDPEDVMALLREYHAAIGGIINTYGGTLERYAGDGVMVVFNDPIPLDNPALQAVLMAIEMRAAIEVLIEKWRKLGHDIGFGIGIAHGFATLGTIGFEGRFDYAAIGTVSNVASRLCDEAKPGQILISPRVLMAVEKDITVEPVGDFALKGIRRPLTAYNVLATRVAN